MASLHLKRPRGGALPEVIRLDPRDYAKDQQFKLGRSGEICDVFVYVGEHPSFLSREHASIRYVSDYRPDQRWEVSDCDSVNGMFVNSCKLQPHKSLRLKHGDKVFFGNPQHSFFLEYVFRQTCTEVNPDSVNRPRRSKRVRQRRDRPSDAIEVGSSHAPFAGRSTAVKEKVKTVASVLQLGSDVFSIVLRFMPIDELFRARVACSTLRAWLDGGLKTLPTLRWHYRWKIAGLRRVLRLCQKLVYLDAGGCYAMDDGALRTIAKSASKRTLRVVDFSGCPRLTESGLSVLGSSCDQLRTVRLRGCKRVASRQWSWLKAMVGSNKHLVHLDLRCCNVQNATIQAIGDRCPQLEVLDIGVLGWHGTTDTGLTLLSKQCQSLRHLDVRGCKRITDAGLLLVTEACHASLRRLILHCCSLITNSALASIGRTCHKLEEVNLHRCSLISDEGVSSLVRQGCRHTLLELDISGCSVTDVSLEMIASHCTMLRRLDVRACKMVRDRGVLEIAQRCGATLRELDVNGCSLTDRALQGLAKHCTELRQLEVGGCTRVTAGAIELVCRECPSVTVHCFTRNAH